MNMVTKILFSLSAESVSLIFMAIWAGANPSLAALRKRFTATAIVIEAGTPLPETSPTQIYNFLSFRKKS